ncbi:hypothetical protein ACH5RR_033892 [Cinchona calisaya]|uniref:Uncharacterized protein n=1 Tax=Cinchona calisaya TaxID=153742 RepID=A0ABD2Y9B2_9GENT
MHTDGKQSFWIVKSNSLKYSKIALKRKINHRPVCELLVEQAQLAEESNSDGESHLLIDQSQLWIKAAGGVKNGHVFGMGPMAQPYVVGASLATTMSSSSSQADMDQDAEVHHLREELCRKDEIITTMKQRLNGLTKSFSDLQKEFATL